MATKKERATAQLEAYNVLKAELKAGQRVYTALQHVSSNGMSRRIRVYVPCVDKHEPNKLGIWDITRLVARACGYRYNEDHHAIVIGGAGMDMGFSIVYSLSSVLFRTDFKCIGEHCRSNDHTNDRDGSWSREKNVGRLHSDGGYALTHSWI